MKTNPINYSDVVNKKYVDSGLKQDGIISDSSNIVPLTINPTSGELSFPLVTNQYVDNFVYDVLQLILEFTNKTGTDLWLDCDLELAAGMSSLAEFFKASDSYSGSTGKGHETLPLIGNYYALIEASTPNNGVYSNAHITHARHQNNTKVKFCYQYVLILDYNIKLWMIMER